MCTAIVGFDPTAPVPIVLAALRDEMVDRPFDRPGQHWPQWPHLIGGRDAQAGGTWLAVAPPESATPRVAAILNGRVEKLTATGRRPVFDSTVPPGVTRRSRGELPLRAAATGTLGLGRDELRAFDPFHLVIADPEQAALVSWDGSDLTEEKLAPGVTVVVNTGLDATAPRAAQHGPRFAATRPAPSEDVLRTSSDIREIWGDWERLLDEAAADTAHSASGGGDDRTSLVARLELPDGRVWATNSVTLLALTPTVLRYAFTDTPGDPAAWSLIR